MLALADQSLGVGKVQLDPVLNHYTHIRQIVLMSDAEESLRKFYESSGFREIKDDLRGFVKVRLSASYRMPTPGSKAVTGRNQADTGIPPRIYEYVRAQRLGFRDFINKLKI